MRSLLSSNKFRLALALCALSLGAARLASAATVTLDANSGGSCKITSGTASATGATINYTEQRTNGELFLWYAAGAVTVNSPNKLTATKRGSGSFTLTGLSPNTLYNVLLHGVSTSDGVSLTSAKYTAKAHFTTDATSGITQIIIDEETPDGPRFDLRGRAARPSNAAGWTGSQQGGAVSP